MKKLFLVAVILLLMQPIRANLTFVEGSFDDFMDRMVDPEHQASFERQYDKKYKKYRDKKQPNWEKKYKKTYKELRNRGQSCLDILRPLWSEQIRMMLEKKCDPVQRQKIDDFLFCCGVYDSFLQNEGEKHHTLWAKTKAYFRNTSNSVVSWFGSWRKPKTDVVA